MTKKRRTNNSFAGISDVLDKVLHQYRPITDRSLIQVWDLWERAVGQSVAANARPAAFKTDVLLVHVSNSTWLHHLRFKEADLVADLNHALGRQQIKQIRFKIGPV
jgi:predicted nucleic acid-binding Zn ribbon protein